MMNRDIQEKLREPFPAADLDWRVVTSWWKDNGPGALVVPYLSSRAVQDRLDEVFGLDGWRVEYRDVSVGVLCGISFRDRHGEWITKWDGSGPMAASGGGGLSAEDAGKGTLTHGLRRAGSLLGIGRYLYHMNEDFATCDANERKYPNRGYVKKANKGFSWLPPKLPTWALPGGSGRPNGNGSDRSQGGGQNNGSRQGSNQPAGASGTSSKSGSDTPQERFARVVESAGLSEATARILWVGHPECETDKAKRTDDDYTTMSNQLEEHGDRIVERMRENARARARDLAETLDLEDDDRAGIAGMIDGTDEEILDALRTLYERSKARAA